MKRIIYSALVCVLSISVFTGCSKRNVDIKEDAFADNADQNISDQLVAEEETNEVEQAISEEQAITAIRKYCYICNPDLENIVNEGQYPVYWEVVSSDEKEIVILFRSYTGAQIRYYIDRNTGDTYVTEFIPGITDEEERTDEHFNVKDYLDQYTKFRFLSLGNHLPFVFDLNFKDSVALCIDVLFS